MPEEDSITRLHHGEPLPIEDAEVVVASEENLAGTAAAPHSDEVESWPFDYIFPELACDDLKVLPILPDGLTVKYLQELGQKESMLDLPLIIPGVPVPTIYTFFGQFVDHDITHERGTEDTDLSNPNLMPLPCAEAQKLRNARSPNLELDSLYGSVSGVTPPPGLTNPDMLRIDEVSNPEGLPPGKDKLNDLPRGLDRKALIGDARNDENIILAQLHVAFLRAHNELIDRGYNFEQARKMLIQHYQWIVLEDFLPRVADPAIVKKVRTKGAKFFTPTRNKFFTPLEFSVAAYRFGHSKVRQSYSEYNEREEMGSVTLAQLFTFTRFGGDLGGSMNTHILGVWVIDWKGFLNSDKKKFFSRPIDTRLAEDLFDLRKEHGASLPDWKKNLAVRNLLRGYLLRIPTGQAVAEAMHAKTQSIVRLTPDQIASAVTEAQRPIMERAGFLEHTPLWFYILAEAAYYNKGYHLGPVGSTIVAETLIGILRYSDWSILSEPGWKPTLGTTPGKFDLEDLLRLAGVYKPDAN